MNPLCCRLGAVAALLLASLGSAQQLHVTVDFNDDYRKAGGPVARANIDQLMARFAELGIDRVYWIHNAEDHYLPRPLTVPNVDLLESAVTAAHRHGMELYASYKPFETGHAGTVFPHNIPLPGGDRTIESISGHHPVVAPFVLNRPEYRLRRREFAAVENREIDQIKLVKADDEPTRLKKRHLRLFTSRINGAFKPHVGDFDFRDSLETRDGRSVRVLTLSGLGIPRDVRYVMVQSVLADGEGDFENAETRLIEIYDAKGKRLPSTVDEGRYSHDELAAWLKSYHLLRHGKTVLPEKIIPLGYGRSPTHSGYHFDGGNARRNRVLDGTSGPNDAVVVVAKGRNEYTAGALHPVYAEVRDYWRNEIRSRCLDAGVDGISIRIANHSSWTSEGSMFGFNPPAIQDYKQRYGESPRDGDGARWKQLQGEYFTQFLRELKQDLAEYDARLQVSVNYLALREVPGWRRNNVPENFTYEWKKWITEDIADSVELKYLPWPFGTNRESGRELIEPVARLARESGKPIFTNVRIGIPWREVQAKGSPEVPPDDPRLDDLRAELRAAWHNKLLDGVILYEGAAFTKMIPETGETVMAQFMKVVIDELRR